MASPAAARRTILPYAILGIALTLTVTAAQYAARSAEMRDRLTFENAADRVRGAIDSRIDAYTAMLLGGAGLFAASDDVSMPEFRAYVERLELPRRYPGIQGIGFTRVVAPADRDRVAAEARQYIPSFHYRPEQPAAATVHAIVYLEPLDERNLAAIGYDMFSEPTRRAAMARARDMAAPAATRRVVLVQEIYPGRKQAGFLIYVPVYLGGGVPDSLETRRERLFGFVYSPFRVDDFLAGILGPAEALEVAFDVFDGPPGEEQLLHRGERHETAPRFLADRSVDVLGQEWTLRLRSGPAFSDTSRRTLVRLVTLGGVLLSFLLFAATMSQVRARAAAELIAEDLRRSEEALRQANRAKDEFLAIISHELRTPLNAMVGWAAMLRRGQVPPAKQAHAIEVIERNAAAQAKLIDELLDISRAVAGHLRLEVRPVEITSTLTAAIEAVRPAAASQGIAMDCSVPPTLGTIQGDHARLQQVLLNLLSNAIKFTPPGGRVTVDAVRQNGTVTIRVADTGIGISREFLPFVFERFRQADTSTTRTYSGVGLGLAIARHLVELHGGSIEAASEGPDRGSTFIVRLPESPASGRLNN